MLQKIWTRAISAPLFLNGSRTHTKILKRYRISSWPKNIKLTSGSLWLALKSTRPGWPKLIPRASEDSSEVFVRKISPSNDLSKIYLSKNVYRPGRASGEPFGCRLMNHVTSEASES